MQFAEGKNEMTITMPRGDIRRVRFLVYEHGGERLSDIDFDEIYFTVKKNTGTAAVLLQKTLTGKKIVKVEDGVYQFTIDSADTDQLKPGKYVFDIELCFESTIKQTSVGTLELTDEVTFAENE